MYKLDEVKPLRKMWIKMANIPEARRGWLLEDCVDVSADSMASVRRWIDVVKDGEVIRAAGNKRCGKGLLLWGEPGHGKTTLSLAIIQEIMTTFPLDPFDVQSGHVIHRPCYFATFNDILALKGTEIDGGLTESQENLLKGMYGEAASDAYNVRILIIDDLGKEHTTLSGWQRNTFHDILRTRFNHGLPTIVTTNIKLENWASEYGDATESFANEAFLYLPITAAVDLRQVRK